MCESILACIQNYSIQTPNAPALCVKGAHVSYQTYWDRICRVAYVLQQAGVKAQDHVLLIASQSIAYLEIFSAVQYLGALPVPLEKKMKSERVLSIAREVDASVLIAQTPVEGLHCLAEKTLLAQAETAPPLQKDLPHRDALSMLLYTTGTTGASKGVLMAHKADVAIAQNVAEGTRMRQGNCELLAAPLNHSFALRRYQTNMYRGGCVCLLESVVFIEEFFGLIEDCKVTSFAMTPGALGIVLRLGAPRLKKYEKQLDFVQVGSAPLIEADKEKLLAVLPRIRFYNLYGSSEAGCSCIIDVNDASIPHGCIGLPTVNAQAVLLDEEDRVMPASDADHPGFLCWKGAMLMEGYYNAPQLTEETLRGGLVHSSDLAYQDAMGRYILVGRADDVINCAGNKIAPLEVEDVVLKFPGVRECALGSKKDPVAGEIPVLLAIVEENGYNEEKLMAYLRENLEGYKVPKEILYVNALPRTFNGKLLRRELGKLIEQYGEEKKHG